MKASPCMPRGGSPPFCLVSRCGDPSPRSGPARLPLGCPGAAVQGAPGPPAHGSPYRHCSAALRSRTSRARGLRESWAVQLAGAPGAGHASRRGEAAVPRPPPASVTQVRVTLRGPGQGTLTSAFRWTPGASLDRVLRSPPALLWTMLFSPLMRSSQGREGWECAHRHLATEGRPSGCAQPCF